MEVVEDPPSDILSKPITEPGADPGGGGGIGLGAPPAISTEAVVGAAGFTVGWAMGAGTFTTLACACGAIAHIVDGTGANRVTVRQRVWRRGNPQRNGGHYGGEGKFSCGRYGIGFIP